ncbi:unnamed protein product [Somion occarium]|uniref:Uncharacterized protein n=1 Tax=Somion occarium TaxID=3059160 RepID=A0ABP1D6F5_9APHY
MAQPAALSPPRQGILLNPSPTASPYTPPVSLPGTPQPSYSSLSSSSASSQSHSDSDNYFLTSTTTTNHSASVPGTPNHRSSFPLSGSGSFTPPNGRSKPRQGSTPTATRPLRIRFAPLPDPRRDDVTTDNGLELPFDKSEQLSSTLQAQPTAVSSSRAIDAAGSVAAATTTSSGSFANAPNGVALIRSSPPGSKPSSISGHDTLGSASSSGLNIAVPNGSSTIDKEGACVERSSDEWTVVPPQAVPPKVPSDPSTPRMGESPPGGERECHHSSGKSKWTKNILKPLFGGSRKHSSSNASHTDDDRISGVNGLLGEDSEDDRCLSRTNSRSSTKKKRHDRPGSSKGSEKPPGVPLTRVNTRNESTSSYGVPLGRSQSDTLALKRFSSSSSHTTKTKRKLSTSALLFSSPTSTSLFSSKSKDTPLSRSQSLNTELGGGLATGGANVKMGPGGVRRGQLRMLNGRVYGARRVDPFANVRDEEPEFVEWGYGGMGSVNSTSQGVGAGIWARVQAGAGVSIGAHDESSWGASSARSRSSSANTPTGSGESTQSGYVASGGSGRGGEEDDDGSGMAWVKRRREMREKEKKAKEEKEAQEAKERAEREKTLESEQMGRQEEAGEKMFGDELDLSPSPAPALTVPPTTTTTTTTTAAVTTEEPEHITTAINLPAPRHLNHHHSHSHSHPLPLHYNHPSHHHHAHTAQHKRTVSSSSVHSHHSHISHRTIIAVPAPERRGSADTARGVPFSPVSPGIGIGSGSSGLASPASTVTPTGNGTTSTATLTMSPLPSSTINPIEGSEVGVFGTMEGEDEDVEVLGNDEDENAGVGRGIGRKGAEVEVTLSSSVSSSLSSGETLGEGEGEEGSSSVPLNSSVTEDEDGDGDTFGEGEGEDEEDEDVGDEDQNRKTVAGAGVEKISRHKEKTPVPANAAS